MQSPLVAYFSATGHTAALAKTLAGAVGARLYEITPQTPYTEADLDWRSRQSRCAQEMRDPALRPAIAGTCADVAECDVLFIGFPIWWYFAPAIVHTFLESYTLAGKKIVPFATSGGSGIGKAGEKLAASANGAVMMPGAVFPPDAQAADLAAWVKSLNL